MGTHERGEKGKQSSGTAAEAIDLGPLKPAASPIFDSAQVLLERAHETNIDLPAVESAPVEAPQLSPESEQTQPEHQESEALAHDAVQTESPTGRVNRFSLLAACLALAAALGGMVGALAAFSLARPVAPAPIVTAGIGTEELQTLRENVVQARVDLAALKASVDGGNRNGNVQLAKITERIERMERNQAEPTARLSKAAENLERIARAETTASIVPPQPVGPRPAGPEAWALREVRHGTAFLEGRGGTIEVEPGDVVPGMGRVEDIRKQDGRWIVVTAKGVITSRR